MNHEEKRRDKIDRFQRTHKEGDSIKLSSALRSFLESWPYDVENNVRVARGADGREIILVRQPMGVEQYEIDGPPDGRRLHGMESVFDFHHARINAAKQSNAADAFDLSAEDCAELLTECLSYDQRLILLFRLKNWTRVAARSRGSRPGKKKAKATPVSVL